MLITAIFHKDGAHWKLDSDVDWETGGLDYEETFQNLDDLTEDNFDICAAGFRQLFGDRVDTSDTIRVCIGSNPPANSLRRYRLERLRTVTGIWKIASMPAGYCGGPTPWPAVIDMAITRWASDLPHPDQPVFLWAETLDDITWPAADTPVVGPAANPITGISLNLTLFQAEQALRALREQGIQPELIPIYDALVQFGACLENEEETT